MELLHGSTYRLRQFGGGTQILRLVAYTDEQLEFEWLERSWVEVVILTKILIDRTRYLNGILPYPEIEDAIFWLESAIQNESPSWRGFSVECAGHIYRFGRPKQRIVFVRRSEGSISYARDWPGVRSQELMRVVIDRLKNLQYISLVNEDIPNAIFGLRMALFMYEVCAWRRKAEGDTPRAHLRVGVGRSISRKTKIYTGIPFGPERIEHYPTGDDGHIILGGTDDTHIKRSR